MECPEITDEQRKFLHGELQQLQKDLQVILADGSRTETVDLDLPIGRLSRVDALQQQAMAEAERRRAELRMTAVEAALEFFAEGDYGFCKACGENMPFGRLKARPEAPLCVACLRAHEQR